MADENVYENNKNDICDRGSGVLTPKFQLKSKDEGRITVKVDNVILRNEENWLVTKCHI